MSPTEFKTLEYSLSADYPHFNPTDYKGITQDSRAVKPGFIFAALKGQNHNGEEFIAHAIEQGATCILCAKTSQVKAVPDNILILKTENPRKTFAHMTAGFYGHKQPEYIIGVTGTNGKSSVVEFTKQLWSALGLKAQSIGTLSHTRTTPDPAALHKMLSEMAGQGTTHLVMEASSHGLDQYRMDGLTLKVAAMTNITQDHLDYHKTMEHYKASKFGLFARILKAGGTAILNADTPEFLEINNICEQRGIKTLSYGKNGRNVKVITTDIHGHAQNVTLQVNGKFVPLTVPLVGSFQIMNLACALACVIAEEPHNTERTKKLLRTMEKIKPVRGRLEHVASEDKKYHAYVDYAHTPDALETVLKALRPHAKARLICIFGCGGDRDRSKRPKMGKIAEALADLTIITNDNPRSENPEEIRAEIISGIANRDKTHDIGDRDTAIKRAVATLSPNDILLIAGKGHEQGQTFKNQTLPFDDVSHCRDAFLVRHSVQPLTA